MLRRSTLVVLIATLGSALPARQSAAVWDERLELFVADELTRDDNVFRLATGVDPSSLIGLASRGDTYRKTSAGLALDIPLDAQRVEAGVTLTRYRFGRFAALDFDGHQAQAAWHWQAGERLRGNVGYAESASLASLANLQSGTQSTTPNLIDSQRTYATATYELTAHWELGARVVSLGQHNRAIEYRPSDLDLRSTEAELAYVTRAASRVGVGWQNHDGRLPNMQVLGGTSIDNSYRQSGVAAFIDWQTSRHSRLTASVASIRRVYQQVPGRNFAGSTYRATQEWQPLDGLQLSVVAQRDISTTEEINVGFVLVEGLGLQARWKLTERVELGLDAEHNDRRYLGDAARILAAVPTPPERVRLTAVRLSHRPLKALTLDFVWRREQRRSAGALANYNVGIASIGARVSF